jgi:hypothetical protein
MNLKMGTAHKPTLMYALVALVVVLGLYHVMHKH